MKIWIAILVLASANANAEVFKCQSGTEWQEDGEVVVLAVINEDGRSGTINTAGIAHRARVTMEGIDRRWDFDLGANHVYKYAFVISPDGVARYYDFSNKGPGQTVTASQVYVCR